MRAREGVCVCAQSRSFMRGQEKIQSILVLPPPPLQASSPIGLAKPGPHLDQETRPETPGSLQGAAWRD